MGLSGDNSNIEVMDSHSVTRLRYSGTISTRCNLSSLVQVILLLQPTKKIKVVKCSGMIITHCILKLLGRRDLPISAYQKWGSHYVTQAGLELLTSSNPPTYAFQSDGITSTLVQARCFVEDSEAVSINRKKKSLQGTLEQGDGSTHDGLNTSYHKLEHNENAVFRPGMVAHACNPSTLGSQAYNPSTLGGRRRQIPLAQEFKTSLGNMVKPHLYKKYKKKLARCGGMCPSCGPSYLGS
ncbi:hypothetical protein AAY473_006541 [Plecturocebus cupreus]